MRTPVATLLVRAVEQHRAELSIFLQFQRPGVVQDVPPDRFLQQFPDRLGELWWLVLEAVIARNDRIVLVIDGRDRKFDCRTAAEKSALYDELYWWLRAKPTEKEMRGVIHSLAAYYHVDVAALCDELCMGWPELAELAADPLITIGAHTVSHPMLAKLSKEAARSEMDLSRSVIEAALSRHGASGAGPASARPDRMWSNQIGLK